MSQTEENYSTASEYARTRTPATGNLYGPTTSKDLSYQLASPPLRHRQLYAAPSRASAARAAPRANCAKRPLRSGARRWRTTIRRSRFGARTIWGPTRCRPRDLWAPGGPSPRSARRASSFAFAFAFALAEVSRARSVRSGGRSTSLSIRSINIFIFSTAGEEGWGG